MSPTLLACLYALLGLPAGVLLVRFADRRSQEQPIDVDVAAEQALLLLLSTHNELAEPLAELDADSFTSEDRRAAFSRLQAGDSPDVSADGAERLEREQDQAQRRLTFHRGAGGRWLRRATIAGSILLLAVVVGLIGFTLAVGVPLLAGQTPGVASVALGLVAAGGIVWLTLHRRHSSDRVDPHQVSVEHVTAIQLGNTVAGNAQARTQLNGRSPIVPGDDPAVPLVRAHVSSGRLRTTLVAGVAAGSFALIPLLASTTGLPALLVHPLLAVMVAISVHVALVDIDTYLLDTAIYYPVAAVVGIATVATVATGEDLRAHLVAGLGAWASVLALVWVLSGWMMWRRGTTGWGGGDTRMLPVVVAAPAALLGDVVVGLTTLIVAAVAATIYSVPSALAEQRDDVGGYALPLLPFLAAGWPVGWLLAAPVRGLLGLS